MSGFLLKEGKYEARNVSQDELWSAFSCVFSSKSRNDSSYKFGFLKSIIDNLYNVDQDLKLSFDQLFSKFGEIYWNLILKYGLKQKASTSDNRKTLLEQVLRSAVVKYNFLETLPYEQLSAEAMIDITHQIKIKCKQYVVGALFEDTKRLFYSFSKKEEWLQINPVMYEFLCKHKLVIEKLNYYEWAKFLEKVNEKDSATGLLNKIDASSKRNNLSKYRKILFDEFETKNCFYCGKELRSDKIDIDHFIPWSFIKDDKLWNLVATCPSCNRKKNDRLPDKFFLDKIIERNMHISSMHKEEMQYYQEDLIRSIYNWALINGYNSIWIPSNNKLRE